MNDLDELAEVRASDPPDLAPDLSRANNQPATDREAHTSRHPTGKESRVARASRQQLASQVNTLDPSIHRWKRLSSRVVRDEFQEAAVGIPEVDADPLTLGAKPRNRAGLNLDAMLRQVSNRVLDRSRPPEA
jgi:hypothetical protein